MKNPLAHLRKNPKICQQLIGLTLLQLEQLIKNAIATEQKQKKEAEAEKKRVNKKGAGRPNWLPILQELLLASLLEEWKII